MTTLRTTFRQLHKLQRHRAPIAPRVLSAIARRCSYYSTDASPRPVDIEAIRAEMLSRPPQVTWDVMSPTNSHLLNIALADFLPESCQPKGFRLSNVDHALVPRGDEAVQSMFTGGESNHLPAGHHLVYFPLQAPASKLCSDGTDPFHSPGGPFVRRMWAGGSIKDFDYLRQDGNAAVCVEDIDDVIVKGVQGLEKIYVDVRRKYMRNGSPSHGIQELRTLVFMRERSPGPKTADTAQGSRGAGRIVRAPRDADYSVTLTPTPTLLFQYSALTFNAHAIHLDPEYCREVEGHRNLLVHGPLILTLMLSILRSQLGPRETITAIDYRNLAPLYVGEPMRICLRYSKGWHEEGPPNPSDYRRWEVWVEDKDGGLSVRGTARTRKMRYPEDMTG